jgi:hypothetical protein
VLQLDRAALPDWLYIWEGDFENLSTLIGDHIRTVVSRYRGKVSLWQCGARMNVEGILSLTEEQRLRLAVLSVEATRQADPRVPVVLWIDQPWAEFMSRPGASDLSPLHFADALVRADLGLAGLGLEINLGYYPGGTQPRDLLDFSRLIDRWSCLGLPLLVSLTIPSDGAPDPHARLRSHLLPGANGQVSVATQSVWVAELLPLLLSKQSVQGVFWNQLLDSAPHDFAHGGLWDGAGRSKPALLAIQAARRQYLG